jgi:hypothetical protein
MPEIGTSGLMSGDGKRGVGHRPQATAPILDSTGAAIIGPLAQTRAVAFQVLNGQVLLRMTSEIAG